MKKLLDTINRYLGRDKHEFVQRLKYGKNHNMTDDPGPY